MNNATGLFILLCWIALIVFITISAFSVKRTVKVARGWKWSWVFPAAFAALVLFFDHTHHLTSYLPKMKLWPRTFAIGGAADILTFIGLVIAVWGRIVLGRNWNLNPGLKENHELIARGPYAWVRHPMYSGLILMLLGTVIWHGNGAGFIFFFVCFLGAWFKLRQEEKLLTAHFGESYLQYKTRVKALIPFVF